MMVDEERDEWMDGGVVDVTTIAASPEPVSKAV
jgi:hypothetical protein